MTSREVTLKELWQTCRVCEDSCRRMADVLGEVMRQAEGAPPLRPVTVEVGLWEVCRGPEPGPHCMPPGPCGMPLSALADKAELLARRVSVLVDVSRSLRDQNPPREIIYYTCVPESPKTPLP
jgi:hypothetical protein